MDSNKVVSSAYKGLFLNQYFDLRKTLLISSIVIISISLFDFAMVILFLQLNEDMSNDASGILVFGTIAIIIAFSIYMILSTSKEKLREKFSFPIDRKIFAISNFSFSFIASFLLIVTITVFASIELLLYKLLDLVSNKFMYVNLITLESYITGLISTWMIIIAAGSFVYCISLYSRLYLQYFLPILGVLFTSIFLFGWIPDIIVFMFFEESLYLLVLKLLSFSLICHGFGFLALKKTEVA